MIVSTYFNTLRFILFRVLLHRHCPEGRTPSHGHHRRLCGAVYAAAECYTPEGHGVISLSYHPGTVVCSDTAVRHIVKYLLWPRLQEPTRCRSSGPGHLVAGLKLHSSSEQDNGQEENKNPGKRVQNNKLTARAVLLKRSSAGEGIKFWVIFSSHRAVPQKSGLPLGLKLVARWHPDDSALLSMLTSAWYARACNKIEINDTTDYILWEEQTAGTQGGHYCNEEKMKLCA